MYTSDKFAKIMAINIDILKNFILYILKMQKIRKKPICHLFCKQA